MGRLGLNLAVWLAGSVLLVAGCNPGQSGPNPGLKITTTSESAAEAKTIFLVLPGAPEGFLPIWVLIAQREAGALNAIFRISGPAPGEPPSKQGDSIRRAVGDGAQALIVVPADEPDTAVALAEVAAKQIPVVLLGKPLAANGSPVKSSFTVVAPAPFGPSARQIVGAALGDAKKNGRPGDGIALILSNAEADPFAPERSAALKAAAEAAGVRKAEVLTFDGEPATATRLVVDAIKAQPDVVAVLADDDLSLMAAIKARRDLKGNPNVFLGGYVGLRGPTSAMAFFQVSGFVEFRADQLAKLAVKEALDQALGKPAGPRIEQSMKLSRGTAPDNFEEPIPNKRTIGLPPANEEDPSPAPK